MLSAFNMSFTANPLSAMIAMPGLSSSLVRNPDTHVSYTSEMDPTYKGDMYTKWLHWAYKQVKISPCYGVCTGSTLRIVNVSLKESLRISHFHQL